LTLCKHSRYLGICYEFDLLVAKNLLGDEQKGMNTERSCSIAHVT